MSNRVVDEFSLESDEVPVSKSHSSQFGLWAGLTSTLPVYAFSSMLGFGLLDNLVFHVIGFVLTAFVIFVSYGSRADKWADKLLDDRTSANVGGRRKAASSKEKKAIAEEVKQRVAEVTTASKDEAAFLSVLYNNIIFLFTFVVFAFYMFNGYSELVNFSVSVPMSAFIVYLFATDNTKRS